MSACGGGIGGEGSGVATVRDSAGIRIVENDPAAAGDTCAVSAEPTLDLGLVDGPEEYQFYRMFDGATLSDGRIAVVNQGSDEVRVFHADGSFDRAFGSRGGGPGEFNDVFLLWVTAGDTIVVGDYRPWRFSFFTAEGEFVRAVIPEPRYPNVPAALGVMGDGSFVISEECCIGDMEGWVPRELHTVWHAPDGALRDTLRTDPNGLMGWLDEEIRFMGRPVFEATTRVAARGRRIAVGQGLEREIEVLELPLDDPDLETSRSGDPLTARPVGFVRWTGDDRTVTDEDLAAYRQEFLDRIRENPDQRRFSEPQISEDRPVAARFPSHAAIRLGVAGDLWVHEYPRPRDEGPAPWLVFDEEGRFRCHAVLPEGLEVYEFGPDYLLGERRDDLEVEHLVRYALTRP